MKVPRTEQPQYDAFQWLSDPPDTADPTLTWYIDGSLVNGKIPELATTGFAIVVTDKESNVIAWGMSIPPHWVIDAAGAEAWALALTLKMCPEAPTIITDCKGLLSETAAPGRGGTSRMHVTVILRN